MGIISGTIKIVIAVIVITFVLIILAVAVAVLRQRRQRARLAADEKAQVESGSGIAWAGAYTSPTAQTHYPGTPYSPATPSPVGSTTKIDPASGSPVTTVQAVYLPSPVLGPGQAGGAAGMMPARPATLASTDPYGQYWHEVRPEAQSRPVVQLGMPAPLQQPASLREPASQAEAAVGSGARR